MTAIRCSAKLVVRLNWQGLGIANRQDFSLHFEALQRHKQKKIPDMVELVDGPIPIEKLLSDSANEECGATVLFLGTTRRWTGNTETGRTETAYLEYQGYRDMAVAKMKELERIACERWPIRTVALVHRLGRVEIQEPSVAVIVCTPHRSEAFEAGKWLIDELKKQVPIWKKEWFAAQPPKWIHPTGTP